ncbi:MAG: hypothetical protein ACYTF6_02645 [Planctomycetota bacterium]
MFTCVGRRVELPAASRKAMDELGAAGRIIAADITPAPPGFQKALPGCDSPRVHMTLFWLAAADG